MDPDRETGLATGPEVGLGRGGARSKLLLRAAVWDNLKRVGPGEVPLCHARKAQASDSG